MKFNRTPPPTGPKPSILIVDDEQHVLDALTRGLRSDYDVSTADNGIAATTILHSRAFDIILSDVVMPGIDGVELLRLVRTYDLDVPVMLMSGAPTIEHVMRACELGAAGYLMKPLTLTEIKERLTRALALRRLTRAKREALELVAPATAASTTITDRAGLSVRLENALAKLRLVYQPIVNARERRIVAYEALMRSGEPALATPAAILGAAERLNDVESVTDRVMELAADAVPGLPEGCSLFVNIHADDLRESRLLATQGPLTKYAKRVVLEVTERGSVDMIEMLPTRMALLRKVGYRIAIDDLGAGYSGLTTLAAIEPDIVKIDMALVRGIDTSIVRQRVVLSIVQLCRELNMEVVAEGIETREELATVNEIGCDLLQGYYLGRPKDKFVIAFPDF